MFLFLTCVCSLHTTWFFEIRLLKWVVLKEGRCTKPNEICTDPKYASDRRRRCFTKRVNLRFCSALLRKTFFLLELSFYTARMQQAKESRVWIIRQQLICSCVHFKTRSTKIFYHLQNTAIKYSFLVVVLPCFKRCPQYRITLRRLLLL